MRCYLGIWDLLTSPHYINVGVQLGADSFEVFGRFHTRHCSGRAVLGGTEQKFLCIDVLISLISDGDLGVCEGFEHFLVSL